MKRIILLYFCLIPSLLYAQDKSWCIVDTYFDYEAIKDVQETYNIKTLSDSTIDGKTYLKTSYRNSLIREDNGIVYYLNNDEEYVLYDFTMKEHDKIFIEGRDVQIECLSVEMWNGLKKINVKYTSTFTDEVRTDTWIEGMGSCMHPFWIDLFPTSPGAHSLCVSSFRSNNVLTYSNESLPDCETKLCDNIDIPESNILSPNPVSDILNINLPYRVSECSIVNSNGAVVWKGTAENNQINVSLLPTGVYFLKVGNEGTYKFVKQ